jgi:gliding motility-associated-like protein
MVAVPGITYSWLPTSGLSDPSSSNPTANPTATTTYVLTAFDPVNGCSATDQVTVTVNTAVPTASVANDFTISCASNPNGLPIGGAAQPGVSYSWSPATGLSSATAANPTANPSATTTYTLISTNTSSGCTATDDIVVTVNTTPPIAAAGADFTKTCALNPTGLAIGMAADPGVAYAWSPTTGLSDANNSNPTANPSATTTYTLTATNTANGCTATDQVVVTVDIALPTANAGGDFLISCISNQTGGALGTPASPNTSYSWSPSTGLNNAATANPTANPSSTTTYTLTATNAINGCTATDQVVVAVDFTLPVANAGTDFTKTCVSNVTGSGIGAPSVAGVSYSWSPTTGLSASNISNPGANPNVTTTYTVTATQNSSGCTATDNVTVTVNTVAPIAQAGTDFSITCTQNSSGALIGMSPVAGITYSWLPPTGLSDANSSNPTANPSVTTTYVLTALDPLNGCTSLDEVTVTVDEVVPAVNAGSDFTKTCTDNQNGLFIGMTPETGVSYSWSPSNGLSASNIANPLANPSVTTTYILTATDLSSGCTSSDNVTVTVNSTVPVAEAGNPFTITCTNNIGGQPIGMASQPGLIYSWTPAAGLSSSNVSNPTANPTQTTSYTLTVSDPASGCSASDNVLVTVDALLPNVFAGNDIVICAGQSVTLTATGASTYLWNNGVVNGVSFVPTATATYSVLGTDNATGCTNTDLITVTVNPVPSVSVPGNQTLCNGQTTAAINFSATPLNGTVISWTNSQPSIGLLPSGIGNTIASFNAINTTLNSVTGNIVVTPTFTNAGLTCTGTSQNVSITVNPAPVVTSQNTLEICSGTNVNHLLTSTITPGTTFTWIATDNPNVTGESTLIQNTNLVNNVLNNTTTTNQLVSYTVTPFFNGCAGPQQTITVTVKPIPAMTSAPTTSICSNLPVNLALTSNVANTTFSWIANTDNPNVSGESFSIAQLSSTITDNLTNNSINNQIVNYTVTPVLNNCSGSPQTVQVTVQPRPDVISASTDSICSGETLNFSFLTNINGSTFTWSATNNADVSGESTATQNTVTISETLVNSTNNNQIVTYTVTPTFNGCSGTSELLNVTVLPTPQVTNANITVCSGDILSVGLSSNVNNSSFTWTALDNVNVTGESLSTQNTGTISDVLINNTIINQIVNYTITPNTVGCVGNNQTISVTVKPAPFITNANQLSLCSGNNVGLNLTSSILGSTFAWSAANNNDVSGESSTSQSSAFINDLLQQNTTVDQTVVYTVTPSFNGCVGADSSIVVTVKPTPLVTSPNTLTICSGENTNFPLNSSISAPQTTFTWIAADNPNIIGESTLIENSGIINNTLTNSSLLQEPVSYVVTPTYFGCTGPTQNLTVFVNPRPIVTSDDSLLICSGESVNLAITADVTGTTFSWVASNNASINGESTTAVSSSSINDVLINSSLSIQQVNYTITPSANNCVGTVQQLRVYVKPKPSMTSSGTDTICSGISPSLAFTSTIPNSTFSWVASNNANVTGESLSPNTSAVLNDILINTSVNNQVVAYTVAPTFNGCTGANQNVNITVFPAPLMTNPNAFNVCSGTPLNINLTSNVSGTTFSWLSADSTNILGEITTVQNTNTINNTLTLINGILVPQSLVYTIIPTANNCPGGPQTIIVNVLPIPDITSTNSVTICTGQPVGLALSTSYPGTSFSWSAIANANVSGESTTSVTSATITDVLSQTTNVNQTVTYNVTPTIGVCPGSSQTVSVIVKPAPVVTNTNAVTICSGQNVSLPLTSNVVNATFTWVATDNPNVTGDSLSTQSLATINNTLVNTSNTPQTVVYTVNASDNGCTGPPLTVSVTVQPNPLLSNATSVNICSGQSVNLPLSSSVAGTTFSWVATSDNASISNESLVTQNGNTINDVLTNTTTIDQVVQYNVIGTANNCASASQTVTVTVRPKPVMTSASALSICSDAQLNQQLTANIGGSTFSWIAVDNPNVTGETTSQQITSTITDDLVNSTTNVQTVTYNITPSSNGCAGPTQNLVVTVNPIPTVTNANALTICSGQMVNITGLTLTANVSGTNFTWVAADNPLVTGDNTTPQNSAAINDVLINSTSINQQVVYTVTPIGSGCNGNPFSITVTVKPTPVMTSTNAVAICSGQSLNFGLSSSVANTTFSWSATANANVTGETTALQPTSIINDNLSATSLEQVTYTITPTANSCAGTAQILTATVNPNPVMTSANSAIICSGQSVGLALTTNLNGSSFSWSAADNANVTGENTGNTNGSAINDVLINTSNVNQQVTYSITPILNGCLGISQQVIVTIKPTPLITSLNNVSICSEQNVNHLLTSNVANTNFTWTLIADNPNITGESLIAQNGTTINDVLINTTLINQSVNYAIATTSNSCTGQTQTVTVTVKPNPSMTSAPVANLCSNNPFNFNLTSDIVGTAFSWVAENNTSVTGESTTAQTGSVITDNLTTALATTQTVVYTITPQFNGCSGTPQTFTVTLFPTPLVTSSNSLNICSGNEVGLNLTSNVSSATFSWSANDNSTVTGESTTTQTNSIINDLLGNLTLPIQSITYAVTATANGCAGPAQNVAVTVTPLPTVTSAPIATICSEEQVNIALTSSIAGTTFTWQAIDNPTITGESTTIQTSSSLIDNLINTSTAVQNVTYVVVPTFNGCPGDTQIVTVTVKPKPIITSADSISVCSSENTSYTITSQLNGVSFSWQALDNPLITGESTSIQSGSSISNILVNTSNSNQTVVYTITPSLNGCTGNSFTLEVTVKPTPVINASVPSSSTICSGSSPNQAISANVAGTTFTWVATSDNTNVTGESLTDQSTSTISDILVNNSNTDQIVTYSILPNGFGCSGNSVSLSVNITPLPVVNINDTIEICSGAVFSAPLTASVTPGSVFTWFAVQNSNVTGETTATQSTAVVSDNLINSTNVLQTVEYNIIPSYNNCPGSPFTLYVLVKPTPDVTSPNALTICSEQPVNLQLTADVSGTTFTWIATNNGSVSGESTNLQSGSIINDILTNPTLVPQTVTYQVTPQGSTCDGPIQTLSVTVNPLPSVTTPATASICSNESLNIGLTSDISGTSFNWVMSNNPDIQGESLTNQNTNSITNSLINNTLNDQTVLVTVIPSVNGCDGDPYIITVTIKPRPSMTSVAIDSICSGLGVNLPLSSNINGSTFSWLAQTDNSSVSGESLTDQAGSPIDDILISNSNVFQTVNYQVTPTFNGCSGQSQSVNIIVKPTPNVTSAGTLFTCSNDALTLALSSDVTGTTFEWIANADNPNVSGESLTPQNSNLVNDDLLNNTLFDQVVTYVITPSANSCVGPDSSLIVTIGPLPQVSSPNTLEICSGTNVNFTLQSTISGTNYTWVALNTGSVNGESTLLQNGDIVTDVLINSTNINQLVKYIITPIFNGCEGPVDTLFVTVKPTTNVTSTNTVVLCSNNAVNLTLTSAVAGTTYTWSATDNPNVINESATIQTSNSINDVLINNSIINQNVIYTIIPNANGCDGPSQTVTVTVKPNPLMTSANADTICSGETVNFGFTADIVGTTFSWIAVDNSNVTGESLSAVNTNTLSDQLVNNTLTDQLVTYTVTPTFNGCAGIPQTVTVLVRPRPTITNGNTLEICSNDNVNLTLASNIAGTTFNWIATDNPNVNGESFSAATNSSLINDVLSHTQTTNQTVLYTITPSLNGCNGVPLILAVTIKPRPVITSPLTQTICSENPLSLPIVSNVSGTGFTWIAQDNPNVSGESLIVQNTNNINDPLVNNSLVDQTVTYTITPIATGCGGQAQTVSVTVKPLPSVTNPSTATICSETEVNLPLTANIPGTTFTWSATSNPSVANESTGPVPSSLISDNLINTTNIVQTVVYSVVPTFDGCPGDAYQVIVTVNPTPDMTSAASLSLCSENPVNLALTADVAGTTYSWFSGDNTDVTGESTSLQPNDSILDVLFNNSILVQTVQYTVTPTANNCQGPSQTINVSVNPNPLMTSAIGDTICTGETVGFTLTSNIAGATFNWVASDNPSVNGENLLTQNTAIINDLLVNTSLVNQAVTYTITPNFNGCDGTPQIVTVLVKPRPTMTNSNALTICSNENVNTTLTSNIVGTTFTWFAAANGNVNGETTAPQFTGTIDDVLSHIQTSNQIVIYTITPELNGCSGTPLAYTVTVQPVPVITSPASQSICSGNLLSLPLTANVSGTGFTWVAFDNPNVSGESLTNQTTSTINDPLVNTSLVNQVVTYTVTPLATGCGGQTQTVNITINPLPSVTSAANTTICSGLSVNLPLTANIPGTTFTWFAAANNNILTESTVPVASSTISDVLTNTTNDIQTVVYSVIPSNNGCPGDTFIVTVTVNPTPDMTSASNLSFCSNNAVNLNLTADVSGTTFGWLAADNPNITGETTATTNTNSIPDVLINTSLINQAVVYTVIPTANLCAGPSQLVTVTVQPNPSMTSAAVDTICSGETVNFAFSSNIPGTSFSWSAATNSNVSGESTLPVNSNNLSDVLVNNTLQDQTVTYTVTPSFNGCNGTPQTVAVLVRPRPTITNNSTLEICSNNDVNTPLTSNIAGTTFTWVAASNPNVIGESVTVQNTAIINDVLSHNEINNQTVIYTITPTLNGCAGTPLAMSVTVKPRPLMTSVNSAVICSGNPLNFALTSNVAGTGFTWVADDNAFVNGESLTNQTTSSINDPLVNTSLVDQVVTYTVTPLATGCGGQSQTVNITVRPLPSVTSASATTICNNLNVNLPLSANIPGTTFSWVATDNPNVNNESLGQVNSATISDVLSNTSNTIQQVLYTVTPTFNNCPGQPFIVTVTVNPTSDLTSANAMSLCSDNAVNLTLTADVVGTTFSWVAANQPDVTGESIVSVQNDSITDVLVNNLLVNQIVTYTIIPTANNCAGTTQVVQVIVKPNPTMVSAIADTICSGETVNHTLISNITGTTFTWQAVGNPNVTGESTNVQNTNNISDILVNNTLQDQTVTYTVTPTFNGCAGTPQTVNVLVRPNPNMTITDTLIICSGIDVNLALISDIAGTTYTWSASANNNVNGESTILQSTATINDVLTNTSTVNQTVNYTIVPSLNGCSGNPFNLAVIVKPRPVMTSINSDVICSLESVGLDLTANVIGASFTWVANDNPNVSGESTTNQNTPNITDLLTNNTLQDQVVVYNVTPNAFGCDGPTQTVSITVRPNPVVTNNTALNICSGDNVNLPLTSNITGTTFTWFATANGSVTGETTTLQTTDFIGDILTNVSSFDQTIVYNVTPTFGGCQGPAQTITVTLKPRPVMTSSGIVSICSNLPVGLTLTADVAGSTFVWVANADNPNVTGESLFDQNATSITDILTNPGNVNELVTYTVTPSAFGCLGTPQTVNVTVKPIPVMTSTNNQAICSSDNVNLPLTSNVAASTFNWFAIDNPDVSGETTIPQASGVIADVLFNTTFNPEIVNYQVTPTANGCNGLTQNVSITVNPLPHVDPINDVVICNENSFSVSLDSDIPASFIWVAIPNNNVNGETFLNQTSFVISNTLENTSTVPQDVQYVITPIADLTGCVGPDSSFIVTVIPDVILNIPPTVEICSGAPVNAILNANVPSNYSWFTTIDNPNVTGESITTNTGGVIDDILVNNTTTNQIVIYSVTPTSVQGNCVGAAQTIAVTVRPPLALLNTDSLTICSGESVDLDLIANTNVTFNWYADLNINVTGESISAVNSPTINDVLNNITNTPQEVIYHVIGTSTFNGCSSPVFPIWVTVNPTPVVNSAPDQTVCHGVNTTPINLTGSVPGSIYNWTNNNTTTGMPASGSMAIPSIVGQNTTFAPVTSTITVQPEFTFNNVTCLGNSDVINITVNPIPTVYPLPDLAFCNSTLTPSLPLGGPVNGTVYNWFNSNPSVGLGAAGSSSVPAFTTVNSSFVNQQTTVTVTPIFTNNGVSCTGPNELYNITILPTPDVLPVANQIVCHEQNTTAVTFTGNVSGTSFNWTNNNNTIGLGSSGSGNIPSFIGLNSGNTPNTGIVTITPSIQQGTLTCTGTLTQLSIQVNPEPTVNPIPPIVLCHGETEVVDFTSPNPSTLFNWINNNTNVGIPGAGFNDINFLGTNQGLIPDTATIRVVPFFNNNGLSCFGDSMDVLVIVNPTPTVNAVANQTACANSTINVNFSSILNTPGMLYNWTNTNPAIGLLGSGSGNISFNALNSTNGPITATITVTPSFANGGTTCPGVPVTFQITVNPIPVVSPIANQSFCEGTLSAAINFTSTVTGTSFNWTNNNNSIGIGASGSGANIPTFTGLAGNSTNTGNFAVTASYTNNAVTCLGNTQLFSISVVPTPAVDPQADLTICQGATAGPISLTGPVAGTNYAWTHTNTAIGLATTSGNDLILPFTATNGTGSILSSNFTVIPTFTVGTVTCSGTSDIFTIFVNPGPTINPVVGIPLTYCNGETTSAFPFSGSISGTTFTWTNSNTAIGLPASGTGNIPPFTATNVSPTNAPITATITVLPNVILNGNTCTGNPTSFTITVLPTPTVVDPTDIQTCSGSAISTIVFSGSVPGSTYNWTVNNPSIGISPTNGSNQLNGFTPPTTLTNTQTGNVVVTPVFSLNGKNCPGSAQNFNITIVPTPNVTVPQNISICNGEDTNIVDFVNNVIGTVNNWTNSNPSIGLAASGTGNPPIFTATNSTNAPITSTITVTPSFTNSGITCTGAPQTFTITVNPTPTFTISPNTSPLVFCSGDAVGSINFSSPVSGAINYQWDSSNPLIGLNPTSGTGNIPGFTASSSTFQTTSLITVVSSLNGCTDTNTINIIVNPRPILTAASDQIWCEGTVMANINVTGPPTVPPIIYSWTNNNTNIGVPANGSGPIISGFTLTNPTLSTVSGTIVYSASYTNSGLTCNAANDTVVITVVPTPTVANQPDLVVCDGSNVAINFLGSPLGTPPGTPTGTVFEWTNSAPSINIPSGGTGNINATVNTGSIPTVAQFEVTPLYTDQLTTCEGVPETFTITVNPVPDMVDPNDTIVCSGTPLSYIFSSNVPGTQYSWTVTNGANIGLVSASGTGNLPANYIATNTTTSIQTGTILVIPFFVNGTDTCQGIPESFTITVIPQPVISPIPNQTVCSGETVVVGFTSSVIGTVFNWSSAPSPNAIGLPATGSGPTFSQLVSTGSSTGSATVTVVPSITIPLGPTCVGAPVTFTITVNPTPTVVGLADTLTYCHQENALPFNFNSSVNGTNPTSYIWNVLNPTVSIGLPNLSGTGATFPGFQALNPGPAPISVNINVTPYIVNAPGDTCFGNPATFVITVNPVPVLSPLPDITACDGDLIPDITFTSNVANTAFEWFNTAPSIGLAGNDSLLPPTSILPGFIVNTGSSVTNALITIVPSFTNSGKTCTGPTETFTITVNPVPVIVTPQDTVVCEGSVVDLNDFVSNVNNTNFTWTNDNPNIGLAANGTGNIPNFVATNNIATNTPISATITVTPSFTNNGLGCSGVAQQFTIVVNPQPDVTDPADLTLCDGFPASVNFSTSVVGTVFNWINSNPGIGLPANGTGNLAFTATNTGINPISSVVIVTPTYTNQNVTCTGTPVDFNIVVNPSPELTSANQTICSNENVGISLSSDIPSTFAWMAVDNPNVSGETLGAIQFSGVINDQLVNNTNLPQVVNYEVYLTSIQYGCTNGPEIWSVTVNPLPSVAFTTLNNPACVNAAVVFQNNTQGINDFSWNFGDGGTSSDINPSHVYNQLGSYTVWLTATNVATGCTDSASTIVNVLQGPQVGFEVTTSVGCNFLDVVFTDTINAPNTTLTWNFGDGETSNQSGAIDHQYSVDGCYDVTLTVTDISGCSMSLTQEDMVCLIPEPDASFYPVPDSALVSDPIFSFINTSSNAFTYEWEFGDGGTSLGTNPMHEYDDIPQEYVVTLYAYNEVGCYDSAFMTVTVYEDIIYYVPNAFTPNGDGTNDIFLPVLTSGIDLTTDYEFSIYNRWGEQVFMTTDPLQGWDGFYPNVGTFIDFEGTENNKAQDGVYTWKIQFKALQNQDVRQINGHVTLLGKRR